MPERKEILAESVRKLVSLNLADEEIIENLKDVGIAEAEAKMLIIEAKTGIKKEPKTGLAGADTPITAEKAPTVTSGTNDETANQEDYNELMEGFEEPKQETTASTKEPEENTMAKYQAQIDSSPSLPSSDITKLWEKGVLATVDSKLSEMEKLKEEIDTVIDAKVSQSLEKEVKKIEVLMDSQRNLITNKVDSTLETKSQQIETMIDTKIAELKNVNIVAQETLKMLSAQKTVNQNLFAEIDGKIKEFEQLKQKSLSELNTEIMKSQTQVELFINESQEKRDSLDKRINRTLELEAKITEGLMDDARQKIDKMAVIKGDALEAKINGEMIKFSKIAAKVNPDMIQEKVAELYKAKQDLREYTKEMMGDVQGDLSKELAELFKEKEKETDLLVGKKERQINNMIKHKSHEIDTMMKEISPERINATIDSLDEFKQQFVKVIQKNVTDFNSAKKELAQSMQKRDDKLNEHISKIDKKMIELTEFEKSFASELGVIIDQLTEQKAENPKQAAQKPAKQVKQLQKHRPKKTKQVNPTPKKPKKTQKK